MTELVAATFSKDEFELREGKAATKGQRRPCFKARKGAVPVPVSQVLNIDDPALFKADVLLTLAELYASHYPHNPADADLLADAYDCVNKCRSLAPASLLPSIHSHLAVLTLLSSSAGVCAAPLRICAGAGLDAHAVAHRPGVAVLVAAPAAHAQPRAVVRVPDAGAADRRHRPSRVARDGHGAHHAGQGGGGGGPTHDGGGAGEDSAHRQLRHRAETRVRVDKRGRKGGTHYCITGLDCMHPLLSH